MTKIRFFSLILISMLFVSCIFATNIFAYADVTSVAGGTDVLSDLQRDSDFDASEWAYNNTDYSLQVVTVAEGGDNALYVYVYQPNLAVDPLATSINMYANKVDVNVKEYRVYDLVFINRNSVFAKYVVQNFQVYGQVERTYEIVSIYRNWIEGVDVEPTGDNTINEVAFPAKGYVDGTETGGSWTFSNSTGLTYNDLETIEITSKFVGFARLPADSTWFDYSVDNQDCHFIAFSTNRQIDDLLEADIYCETQWKRIQIAGGDSEDYGEPVSTYCHIDFEQSASVSFGYVSQTTIGWKRISSTEDFVGSLEIHEVYECGLFNYSVDIEFLEDARRTILEKQWVVSFLETSYSTSTAFPSGKTFRQSTAVSNVSLLRLAFKTNGKYYNLGVVDNKQTGSSEPVNKTVIEANFDTRPLVVTVFTLLIGFFILIFVVYVLLETFKWLFRQIKRKK